MAKRASSLVLQHVERLPRRILEEHPELVREYVKGRRGIYALYRKTRLYYVGLASDLRQRLKSHLKDHHSHAWDSFSMYLTEGVDHLRELEALILRVIMPKGNRSKTKFTRSRDLKRYFKRLVVEEQRRELQELFGPNFIDRRSDQVARTTGRAPVLAPYVTKRMHIRATLKGKRYRATVLASGMVRFRQKLYTSPSTAASAVTRRAANGWKVWRFEASPGVWKQLDALRHRKRR